MTRARRLCLGACALAMLLGACSSTSRHTAGSRGAGGAPAATITDPTPGKSAASEGSRPEATAVPAPAATGAEPPAADAALPPVPGLYRYRQAGGFDPPIFDVPDEGTLRIHAWARTKGVYTQRQVRTYSSNQTLEQRLSFAPAGVHALAVTQRFGSGPYHQSMTCTFGDPLLVLRRPTRVGATWHQEESCQGLDIDYTATVLRAEQRTVAGRRVATFVIRSIVTASGDGGEQRTETTMWIAPAYRLVVRSVQRSEGSQGGFSFTSTLTEDLLALTPER